jgi:hypothetical protein
MRCHPRWEPDALVAPVRICGGGREQSRSLLRPGRWPLMAGVYVGYQRCSGRESRFSESRVLFVISVLVVLFFFLMRHPGRIFGHSSLLNMDVALQSWKRILHPLRLINFAALAFILSYLPRSIDKFIEIFWPFRLLRFLGRHSLQVFVWWPYATWPIV